MQSSKTKPIIGSEIAVFDLETNGLLTNATRIHCISIYLSELDEILTFNDEPYTKNPKELPMGGSYSITTAISYLEVAEVLVGHNILGFDLPIIKKLYPYFNPTGIIIDTLLLSRLYHPNLLNIDRSYPERKKYKFKKVLKKLEGRHSLESYGYRLGEHKGDFGVNTDWKEWSQDYGDLLIFSILF